MFRGITAVTIDSKGRLAIPARYRDGLQAEKSNLVVTIDTEESCLLLYPLSHWLIVEEKLQTLPSFNASARRIQRLLIGHACELELDSQGRILLPTLLLEYAEFEKGKKVVMIGQGNKFELWNEFLWISKREQWLTDESLASATMPEEMKNFFL